MRGNITMTKSELRSMIREMLHEELAKTTATTLTEAAGHAPDECVLAYYVMVNPGTDKALEDGDGAALVAIVDHEMEANDLHTPGANKFRQTILRLTAGGSRIPYALRNRVAQYIGDSYLKAIGMGMGDTRSA